MQIHMDAYPKTNSKKITQEDFIVFNGMFGSHCFPQRINAVFLIIKKKKPELFH